MKFNIPEAELSNSIICTPSEIYISVSVRRTSGLYRYKNETLVCLVPNDSNTLVGGVAHLDDDSIIYTNMKKGQIMSVSQSTEVNVLSGKEQSAEAPLTSKDGLASNCRSEEHTSELQSPVPISYAVFCLKKKKNNK